MGACCVRENTIIKTAIKSSSQIKKERLRSERSSIYQINKENIYDVYDFCGKISSGFYGKVEKACFKGDPSNFYAEKIISKINLSKKNIKNLIGEIHIFAKLDHPNIIKYYETYDDGFQKSLRRTGKHSEYECEIMVKEAGLKIPIKFNMMNFLKLLVIFLI